MIRGTYMNRTRFFATAIGIVTVAVFAADTYAMYHPSMGCWMQRDPGNHDVAVRVGTIAPDTGGPFSPRDEQTAYVDGLNLYQYVRGNPLTGLDPNGLTRLQYAYQGVFVTDDRTKGAKNHSENLALTQFLENDVEDLLWKYGINAWRVFPADYRNRGGELNRKMFTFATNQVEVGRWSDTNHDLWDLENISEWDFAGTARTIWKMSVDDVIVFVPGQIGWGGVKWPKSAAAHDQRSHVVAVARGFPQKLQRHWIAHEVLHHSLENSIDPGSKEPWHDTEGVLNPNGGTERLGCKTVNALKAKGVTDAEIDQNYVIK